MEEIKVKSKKSDSRTLGFDSAEPKQSLLLEEIEGTDLPRILTADPELNRVLGGGLVPGSVILVAGEPGIGKSTLFLQDSLMMTSTRVLYVSGEESLQQIKLRAQRLQLKNNDFYLFTTTQTTALLNEVKRLKPGLLIIDSIQTLESSSVESAPGSVSQVRECTAEIVRYAKSQHVPVIIIGHITKDGTIAGPKVLEHMVDTVLQFEGDRHYAYRILRSTKNRFGNSQEMGIYEMSERGLRPVTNPSEMLITTRDDNPSGIAIATTLEGARPLLIETQALVTQAVYGTPQRTLSGIDLRRLQLLLAVLEKRGGFHFGNKDVFLNLAGGIRVEDPALDLSIVAALLSSYEDKAIAPGICFSAEVGLSGEIRAVNRIELRILEAERLGFEKIFLSTYNKKGISSKFNIELKFISGIEELYRQLF